MNDASLVFPCPFVRIPFILTVCISTATLYPTLYNLNWMKIEWHNLKGKTISQDIMITYQTLYFNRLNVRTLWYLISVWIKVKHCQVSKFKDYTFLRITKNMILYFLNSKIKPIFKHIKSTVSSLNMRFSWNLRFDVWNMISFYAYDENNENIYMAHE